MYKNYIKGNSIRAHIIHMQTKLFSLALLWIPEETGLPNKNRMCNG